ncbi:MAG: alcohol dehydrogenase catalytic domain-containing protein [Clostridiales bacterium]|jgi:alcohol dehydrogenase|nr:alcohol dehydrogenase catalytic domain-containing protein [Clostridiales bacterium]
MPNTMMALIYHGNRRLSLEERNVPTIQDPRDAIVQVTRSTICTSDLHILNGAVPQANPNTILGHEFVGKVIEIGSGVHTLCRGDRVAANCITFCGECYFCRKGFINNCQKGGWELGCRIDGCQAEYVRVPYADQGLTKIPDCLTDENALFLGDILSSGYFGAELAEIQPGDTVAILGAGPVGLCSMMCAKLFGAAQIIAIDLDPSRLRIAVQQGLADLTIQPNQESVSDAVLHATHGRGADAVIEAAGGKDTFQTAWQIARPNGVVALVAMYEENQMLPLPIMYGKNLVFKTGGVDAIHCQQLIHLLEHGKLNTDFLITHRSPLNDILVAYQQFEQKQDGCLKWVITPWED